MYWEPSTPQITLIDQLLLLKMERGHRKHCCHVSCTMTEIVSNFLAVSKILKEMALPHISKNTSLACGQFGSISWQGPDFSQSYKQSLPIKYCSLDSISLFNFLCIMVFGKDAAYDAIWHFNKGFIAPPATNERQEGCLVPSVPLLLCPWKFARFPVISKLQISQIPE